MKTSALFLQFLVPAPPPVSRDGTIIHSQEHAGSSHTVAALETWTTFLRLWIVRQRVKDTQQLKLRKLKSWMMIWKCVLNLLWLDHAGIYKAQELPKLVKFPFLEGSSPATTMTHLRTHVTSFPMAAVQGIETTLWQKTIAETLATRETLIILRWVSSFNLNGI